MRRVPVRVERGVIGIDLDEEEQGRILGLLVNVKHMAARLALEARAGMTKETFAKRLNDVLTNLEVGGVQERHVVHWAGRGSSA